MNEEQGPNPKHYTKPTAAAVLPRRERRNIRLKSIFSCRKFEVRGAQGLVWLWLLQK